MNRVLFLCGVLSFAHCKSLFKNEDDSQFGQIISLGVTQNATGLYHYTTLNGFFLPDYNPKNFESEVREAHQLLLTKPRDPNALKVLIIQRLKTNNPEGAIALIHGQKEKADVMQVLEAIGWTMLNRPEKAEQIFSSASSSSLVLLNYGVLKTQQGNMEQAVNYFSQVSRDENFREISYLLQGEAQYGLRRFAEAEKSFQRVLSINSDNSLAILNLAQLYRYGLQDEKKAVSYYQRVLNGYYPPTIKEQAEKELSHYLKTL
jgi:tetratricopeptide (TPR) repeat protein